MAMNHAKGGKASMSASQSALLAIVGLLAVPMAANAALSSGTVSATDFASNGAMTWAGANAWVNYLDVTKYDGSNQWALPTTVDSLSNVSNANPSPTSSQMAELFYGQLGGRAGNNFLGSLNGSALFNNVQSSFYWSGTKVSSDFGNAYTFDTTVGYQGADSNPRRPQSFAN
jgi:hypothetical protein